tara:strand:+ start:4848 stop:5645 length:798 start_codon:yes stop_codon:yes gene_type:complete
MVKFRTHKKNNYTIIDNKLIYDNSITAKSKAVIIYLLSKPDEWNTNIRDIAKNFKDGYDSIKSALVELEKTYYLDRKKLRQSDGTFITEYNVYEDKTQHPKNLNYLKDAIQSGKSTPIQSGKSTSGKSTHNISTINSKTKKLYKKEFEIWYSLYDKKVTKKQATTYWDRNIKSEELINKIMQHTKVYIQNTEKQYRLDPLRYLRNEKWEDEIIIKEKSQADREKELLADAEERMHRNILKQKQYMEKAEKDTASDEDKRRILLGR